jgi:hypothetical protein
MRPPPAGVGRAEAEAQSRGSDSSVSAPAQLKGRRVTASGNSYDWTCRREQHAADVAAKRTVVLATLH